MGGWLYHVFGIGGTGPYYGWWSGIGADISELALVAAVWRGICCHEPGCWRPGFNYQGHRVCHRHREKIDGG